MSTGQIVRLVALTAVVYAVVMRVDSLRTLITDDKVS